MDDPIKEYSYDALRRWCADMPDGHFLFLFRLMLVFALPLVVCAVAFRRGSRSAIVQWFCLTLGVLAALSIPVGTVPRNDHLRVWLLTISAVLVVSSPAVLPFFLARKYGNQNRLRVAFYMVLAGILLVALYRGYSR